MKKLISYFLIFTLFITTIPVQIFAQNLDYKPAVSFEYDHYEAGKINPYIFVEKLEKDLLNSEVPANPKDLLSESPSNEWGSPAHLRKTYNNFLYYNINPKDSKLWNKTALIPGNGVTEKDVLAILDHHQVLSEAISYHFGQNTRCQGEGTEEDIRLIPSYLTQFAFALMGVNLGIPDETAYKIQNLDQRLNELFLSVSIYKNPAITISANTDLLGAITKPEAEQIQQHLKQITSNNSGKFDGKDIELIKKYLQEGYAKLNPDEKDKAKIVLGKFLYDMFEGDEVLINKYVRKELLRTYYALVFIEEELDNKSDPLRYNRAIIDLATTYKIQNIQINDNRPIARNNQSETELAYQTNTAMLTRAEVNYLVQLMNIHQKKLTYGQQTEENRREQERLQIYDGIRKRVEEYQKKSDYRINTGNPETDRMLKKVHGGDYYNLTGTK